MGGGGVEWAEGFGGIIRYMDHMMHGTAGGGGQSPSTEYEGGTIKKLTVNKGGIKNIKESF